jgi:hypothetical protein
MVWNEVDFLTVAHFIPYGMKFSHAFSWWVQQVSGLLEIYEKDIERGGQRYPALLSDSTLAQYEVYKTLVWERGWGGGGKSDEDVQDYPGW